MPADLSSKRIAAPLDHALNRVRKTIPQRTAMRKITGSLKHSKACLT